MNSRKVRRRCHSPIGTTRCRHSSFTAVADVLQRTLNPCVAPRRILSRHSHDQGSEVCLQTTTARTRPSVGPFASDQFTLPAQNRVWRDDGRHSREQATAQSVPQFAETSPLTVLETQAPSAEPGLKNAILFAQKRDQICLLTMKPRTYRHDDQLKQSHVRSLGDRIDSVVGHYGLDPATPLRIAVANQNPSGAAARSI